MISEASAGPMAEEDSPTVVYEASTSSRKSSVQFTNQYVRGLAPPSPRRMGRVQPDYQYMYREKKIMDVEVEGQVFA